MKFTKLMIGALALLLLLPLRVAAESIEVTPAEEDYGDLAVGSEPRTQVFDLMSMGPTALTVFLVEITDDTEGAYSITEANGLNESLPQGTSATAEVAFNPPDIGTYTAFLRILSNAGGNLEIFIPLSGTGVEADPQALMDDLLAFFNEKVAAGEIYGRGAIPRIAHARLRVFGRLLDSADDLIVSGDYACAAQVLERALLRSDGRRRPSDFVAGEAVDELYDKIEQLIEVLETS